MKNALETGNPEFNGQKRTLKGHVKVLQLLPLQKICIVVVSTTGMFQNVSRLLQMAKAKIDRGPICQARKSLAPI